MKTRLPAAVAALGLVIMIGAGFLPWTMNSESGPEEIGWFAVGVGLGASCVVQWAAAILLLVRRWWAGLVGAILGLLVVGFTIATTPLGITMWDGVDKYGRPTGGMWETTLGPAPFVTMVGALVVFAAACIGLGVGRRRTRPATS
ncbi:hypothetical protein ACQBAR_01850 [Propionibacteriaceae bacterium Y1685]|uniref:hypothetical protein n=1 Tax=Microlunatus sp. Y1700 TaxID=3418487 RepID=UPI003B7AFE99